MPASATNTEIHRVLGRLEGKVDSVIQVVGSLHSDHKELSDRQRHLEQTVASLKTDEDDAKSMKRRLVALEQRVLRWSGALALLMPVVMAAVAAVFKSFGG